MAPPRSAGQCGGGGFAKIFFSQNSKQNWSIFRAFSYFLGRSYYCLNNVKMLLFFLDEHNVTCYSGLLASLVGQDKVGIKM